MCVRQRFPFRPRFGVQPWGKYGAKSTVTTDEADTRLPGHKQDGYQTSPHEAFFSSLPARTEFTFKRVTDTPHHSVLSTTVFPYANCNTVFVNL